MISEGALVLIVVLLLWRFPALRSGLFWIFLGVFLVAAMPLLMAFGAALWIGLLAVFVAVFGS